MLTNKCGWGAGIDAFLDREEKRILEASIKNLLSLPEPLDLSFGFPFTPHQFDWIHLLHINPSFEFSVC